MLRLVFSIVCILPLAACATEGLRPYQEPAVVAQMQAPPVILSSEQSMAELAVANGVVPCPRFSNNLAAAEAAVDAEPKNYIHML